MKRLMALAAFALALASNAGAQMRGMGRISGTVNDETGAPVAGVAIKAKLPGSSGALDSKSDDKGAWYVGGMGKGEWDVEFDKPGYGQRRAKVILPVELARVPPIVITLK